MKVKIVNCNNKHSWYNDKIGQVFDVVPWYYGSRKLLGFYKLVDNENYMIRPLDGEEVK